MQLNWNPLNVINKTIKNIFQTHNSEQKSKELEPLKVFIGERCSKEKGVHRRKVFQANSNNLYKIKKTLEDKYEKKQKDKMETSGVVYKVDCNYTVEIQLKYVEN